QRTDDVFGDALLRQGQTRGRHDLLHTQAAGAQLGMGEAQVEADLLDLADRIGKVQRAAVGGGGEVCGVPGRILFLHEQVEAPADATRREVRVHVAELEALDEGTLVDTNAYGAAGTQEVLRLQRRGDEEVATTAGTDAEGDVAEVLLFHRVVD